VHFIEYRLFFVCSFKRHIVRYAIATNANLVDSDDVLIHMSKIIPQIWKSDKYKTVAENHITGYAKRLQTIIDNDGDIIAKYK
jgi:hypothetical protein